MKSVLIRLREVVQQSRGNEREIIKFILANPQDVTRLTIHELASATYTSPSSVVRFCKKNGFQGYKDFSKSLLIEVSTNSNTRIEDNNEITKFDSIEEIIEKVTLKNIISLQDTGNIIDAQAVDQAITLMHNAHNICLFGIGSSYNVGRDFQQKLIRLDRHITMSEDWHIQWLTARNMTKGDLGIVISYSGKTDEMIQCCKSMKANGVTMVCLTKYGTNPINEYADVKLYVAANESTFRSGAMSSRISQLNIIDILYTGYANRHYEQSLQMIARTHIRKD
jgi:RpiR family transcriptional regulator, murPQ operon repressor